MSTTQSTIRRPAHVDATTFFVAIDMVDPARPHWSGRRDARKLAVGVAEEFGWEIAQPISRWRIWLLTQAELADWFDVTPRWIQDLEERGLPHEGERTSLRYPWPDCQAWMHAHNVRVANAQRSRGDPAAVRDIKPLVARAEYQLFVAREFSRM